MKDAKKEHAAARWRACSTSPLWYCGNAPEGKGEAHPGECFCGPNSGAIEARRAYYVKDVTGSKGQCQAMRMDGSADAVMEVFQHYDLNEAGVYQRILEDLDVKKRGIGDRLAQTSGNPSLRSTLEAKELELEEKRRAHAIKLAESAELQEETTRELQQFNRTVRAVVQSIDTEFQRVFASVGERGNVELDMAEGVRTRCLRSPARGGVTLTSLIAPLPRTCPSTPSTSTCPSERAGASSGWTPACTPAACVSVPPLPTPHDRLTASPRRRRRRRR